MLSEVFLALIYIKCIVKDKNVGWNPPPPNFHHPSRKTVFYHL